jgi:hypothetical protein
LVCSLGKCKQLDRHKRVKVKFILKQAMKTDRGEQRYSSTLSLTSALDGGGWLTPRPGRLPPRTRPGSHCTGGWVGPRVSVYRCGKSCPHRDSIPGFYTCAPLDNYLTCGLMFSTPVSFFGGAGFGFRVRTPILRGFDCQAAPGQYTTSRNHLLVNTVMKVWVLENAVQFVTC